MKRILIFATLLSSSALAAVISTVSCQAGPATQNTESGCLVGNQGERPSSRAYASFIGEFGVGAGAFALGQDTASGGFINSFAMAEITRSESIVSGGNLRPGFAIIRFLMDGACPGFFHPDCSRTVIFGSYSVGIDQWGAAFCPSLMAPPCNISSPFMVPITLGTMIDIQTWLRVDARTDVQLPSISSEISLVSLTISLFEQDGETPVAWSLAAEVPEPATWGLIALGLSIVALRTTPLKRFEPPLDLKHIG